MRELPKLDELLEEMFGDEPEPVTPEEQYRRDKAAAHAWSVTIAAMGEAQEAARAARGE